MKFHYLDKVKINDGLLNDQIGKVIDYNYPPFPFAIYKVRLAADSSTHWISEDSLELL